MAALENVECVKLTAETFENDAFNTKNPIIHCIVAESNEEIVGYTIYYYSYSTFVGRYVSCESLYVKSHMRKRGIGKRLMTELAKVALANAGRLCFHILNYSPAIKFYKDLGAVNMTETEKWSIYRLERDALQELAMC